MGPPMPSLSLLLAVAVGQADAPVEEAAPATPVEVAAPAPAPVEAEPDTYSPLLRAELGGVRGEAPLQVMMRAEGAGAYALDRYGTQRGSSVTLSPVARVGLRLLGPQSWAVSLMAEYEHDLVMASVPTAQDRVAIEGMPDRLPAQTQLRKAYGRVAFGDKAQLAAGVMTSHWGLGLVANDGAHGWQPGNAWFSDPRSGDRVVRAALSTGPWSPLGIVATVAGDRVLDDDILLTGGEHAGPGTDTAYQLVAAVRAGKESQPASGGLYVAHREQRAADGRFMSVTLVDATAEARLTLGSAKLTLAAEGALVLGRASIAGTIDFAVQRVAQLGAAGRAQLEWQRIGAVLDVVYASGDRNPDDASQNGFRADPNYEMGLLLFRQVMAGQSGRLIATAGDPNLVGQPGPGIERAALRGSLTNTVAAFPRLFVRPLPGLEVYGGPLVAFANVAQIDAFNTRLAGGAPRNALDGSPGMYLGTEVDLGVRYRTLIKRTELTVGLEGGVLIPGNALANASGQLMPPLLGGRAMTAWRF